MIPYIYRHMVFYLPEESIGQPRLVVDDEGLIRHWWLHASHEGGQRIMLILSAIYARLWWVGVCFWLTNLPGTEEYWASIITSRWPKTRAKMRLLKRDRTRDVSYVYVIAWYIKRQMYECMYEQSTPSIYILEARQSNPDNDKDWWHHIASYITFSDSLIPNWISLGPKKSAWPPSMDIPVSVDTLQQ